MPVLVVQVGIVNMCVCQWFVPVPVAVWFGKCAIMLMLMVLIVNMAVLMFKRGMMMDVFVPFSQMQPQSKPHEGSRNQ